MIRINCPSSSSRALVILNQYQTYDRGIRSTFSRHRNGISSMLGLQCVIDVKSCAYRCYVRCAILLVRAGGMPWPQIGTTQYQSYNQRVGCLLYSMDRCGRTSPLLLFHWNAHKNSLNISYSSKQNLHNLLFLNKKLAI